MSRILAAEFRKVFCKRLVWIVLAVVFLANGTLFVFQQFQNKGQVLIYWDDLLQAEQQYQSMPFSEAYDQLKQLDEDYDTLRMYRFYSLEDNIRISEQEQEKYLRAMKRLKGDPALKDEESFNKRSYVVDALFQQAESIAGYPGYIDGMEGRALQMQEVSIFQKPHSFSYRNTVKTPQDFAQLKEIPLTFGNSNGFDALHQFAVTDLLVLAFAFLLCIYLFLQEKENGLLSMVKATPGGGVKTISAKLIVLISCTVLTAGAVYGGNLVLCGWIYGFGDLSRNVQSMSIFRDCNFLMTAGQWILLFWGSKVTSVLLCVFVFSLVFTLFENNKGIYLAILMFLAFSWACWKWIMPLSGLNFLKYVNLFSFLDSFPLFCQYNNINLFGYPVSLVPVCLISAFVAALLVIGVGFLFFVRRKGAGIILPTLWRRRRIQKIRGTSQLWMAEGRKILITQKVWIFLLLAVLVAWSQLDTSPLKMNLDDAVYKNYASAYAGPVTEQSDHKVAQEEEKFSRANQKLQELEEMHSNGEITLEEKEKESYPLTQLSNKEKGFQRFLSQYHTLQQKREQGYPVSVIDELSSDQLFNQAGRDTFQAMVYCVLLLLAICNIFPIDMKKRLDGLIHATDRGGGNLLRIRLVYAWVIAVVSAVILFLPIAVNFHAKYSIADWSAAIQSIGKYQNITASISIQSFVLVGSTLFVLGIAAVTLGILLLSLLCRKQSVTVILGTLILFCPLLLPSLGISFANLYCFNNIFYFYSTAELTDMYPQFFYMASMTAIAVGFYFAMRALFVNRRFDRSSK